MMAFEHQEKVSIVFGKGGRFEMAGHLWQEFSLHPPRHPAEAQAEQ